MSNWIWMNMIRRIINKTQSVLVWNRTLLVRKVTSIVPSAMTIGTSLVPFESRRFWSQTGIDLVEGPQYSIYQKRDQKIEQTPGPGEDDNYKLVRWFMIQCYLKQELRFVWQWIVIIIINYMTNIYSYLID